MITKPLNRRPLSVGYLLGTTFKQKVLAQLKPGQGAIFHKNASSSIGHAHVFGAGVGINSQVVEVVVNHGPAQI